jgi:hemolysin activation/secretion protein
LPWDFLFRVRASGQYSLDRLPASEEFVYGGTDYGQAFYANPLYGDNGVAGYIELAHGLPWIEPKGWLSGTEVFGFADFGKIWNIHTTFAPTADHAASAGFGIRTKLADKLTLQLAGANVLTQPNSVPHASNWSALFTIVGSF